MKLREAFMAIVILLFTSLFNFVVANATPPVADATLCNSNHAQTECFAATLPETIGSSELIQIDVQRTGALESRPSPVIVEGAGHVYSRDHTNVTGSEKTHEWTPFVIP